MKPIEFPEQTSILAKDQPEYQPLPVLQDGQCTVSLWKFTLWERIRILFGANLWLMQLNFGRLLQPQLPDLNCPFERVK